MTPDRNNYAHIPLSPQVNRQIKNFDALLAASSRLSRILWDELGVSIPGSLKVANALSELNKVINKIDSE